MEDRALEDLLQVYNNKLEEARVLNLQSWALNYKCFEDLQVKKMKSKLNALAVIRLVGVVLGIGWVLFLALLIYWGRFKNIFFTVSTVMLLFFSAAAIVTYIKQVIIIKQIDYSGNVTGAQQKLASLQLSTIRILRFVWLQLPFYTTFYWSWQWMSSGPLFWLVAFPVTIAFTLLAAWLYKNISVKNIGTKKGRWLMSGMEFNHLAQAKAFLDEIEEFKNDSRGL